MTASILIVDDADVVATTLMALFRRAGWDASVAGSVADAVASVARAAPDCVVLDRHLPDGDGVTLVGDLRAMVPDGVAIVMLSGDPLDAASVGADAVMLKPAGAREVLDVVGAALQRRAPRPGSAGRPGSP